jgi:hypothetical protein
MKLLLSFLCTTLFFNSNLFSQVQKINLVFDGTVNSENTPTSKFLYFTVKDKPFSITNKISIGAKSRYHFDLSKTIYAAGDISALLFSDDLKAEPIEKYGIVSKINVDEIKKYQKLNNLSLINIKNDFYFVSSQGISKIQKEISNELLSLIGGYVLKSNDTFTRLRLEANRFSIQYSAKLGSNYSEVEVGEWSYKDGMLKLVSKSLRNETFGTYLSNYKRIYELKKDTNSCIPIFSSKKEIANREYDAHYDKDYKLYTDTERVKVLLKKIDFNKDTITATIKNNSEFAIGNISLILTLKDKKTKTTLELM